MLTANARRSNTNPESLGLELLGIVQQMTEPPAGRGTLARPAARTRRPVVLREFDDRADR